MGGLGGMGHGGRRRSDNPAEQSGKNVAKVRAEYSDPKRREMLIGMILENKVLDIIEAKAKITDE